MKNQNKKGIVLYASPIFERDKRIELFTSDSGKLSCLAKNAKSQKSPLRALLDPTCYIEAECYKKTTSISIFKADLIDGFFNIRAKFNTISLSLYLLNLVRFSTEYGQENKPLFDLLLQCLMQLNEGKNISTVKSFFEHQFLIIEGLWDENNKIFDRVFESYTGSKVPSLLLI
jgi:DNA repair protein RecO (recombination protein O)